MAQACVPNLWAHNSHSEFPLSHDVSINHGGLKRRAAFVPHLRYFCFPIFSDYSTFFCYSCSWLLFFLGGFQSEEQLSHLCIPLILLQSIVQSSQWSAICYITLGKYSVRNNGTSCLAYKLWLNWLILLLWLREITNNQSKQKKTGTGELILL